MLSIIELRYFLILNLFLLTQLCATETKIEPLSTQLTVDVSKSDFELYLVGAISTEFGNEVVKMIESDDFEQLKKFCVSFKLKGSLTNQDCLNSDLSKLMIFAGITGHFEAAQILIDNGAYLEGYRSKSGQLMHSLAFAINEKKPEFIKFLLDNGANPNISVPFSCSKECNQFWPMPLIIFAVTNGNLDVVKELLRSKKLEVDAKDNFGGTALSFVVHNGLKDIVIELLSVGADPNVRATLYSSAGDGESVTYPQISFAVLNRDLDIVKELLKVKNLEIDATGDYGSTALILAAYYGYKEMVLELLAAGADKNKTDVNKGSAYDHALHNGHYEVAKLIYDFKDPREKTSIFSFLIGLIFVIFLFLFGRRFIFFRGYSFKKSFKIKLFKFWDNNQNS